MHSLFPDYLAKLRFDTQQLATLRALGEHQGKQSSRRPIARGIKRFASGGRC